MNTGLRLSDEAAAAIGRAWLDDTPWSLLTDLCRLDSRLGGSKGEREAATLVANAFKDAGVRDVSLESFPTQVWTRGDSRLELLDSPPRRFDSVALPYAPSGTVTAEVVDVGHGTPREIRAADVEGSVVVASTTTPHGSRFIHRMEKFGAAVDAGAVGFVFVNHVEGQLPPTGALRFDREAEIPAVGVSLETGEWLTEAAAAGEDIRLSVDATTVDGESQNVVGTLGPDTSDELLLVAHYDAHDLGDGALDNGCGVAVVVGAARLLASMDLSRRVRIVAVGCEETGLVGAEHLASSIDLDDVAVVNVDGAGRHPNMVAMTHASDESRAVAETVEQETGHEIRIKPEPHPFSDQWPFVRRGVPALQLHSDSGDRGRGWGHTAADTRDKVDRRNLRSHTILTALLVREFAARDLSRLDLDVLRDRFRAADFEPGMRAAGLWPAEWD